MATRNVLARERMNTSFIRRPNAANLYTATGARQTFKTLSTKPFANLQNVALSSVKEKVGTYLAYIFKRYHTGKGDDFESVGAIVNNPNLPMDCSDVGFIQPGTPIFDAMRKYGGHFFTVNLAIPSGIKAHILENGKGQNWVQLDYLIIDPRGPKVKISIIEFKAGSTQLVMKPTEEAQMIKATEIFKKWYGEKNVEFHLYYSPFLANQPTYYQESHTSTRVDYLTISGLSKMLRIPLSELQRIGNLRANFQKNITTKLYKLQDAITSQLVAEGVESNLRRNLSTKTPANFGINMSTYGNFGARGERKKVKPGATPLLNFKATRSNVTQLMTAREKLKKQYLLNPTNTNLNRITRITANILNRHKVVPILTNTVATNLSAYMSSLQNAYTHVPEPRPVNVWETFIEERADLLGASQWNIPTLSSNTNFVPKKDIHLVNLERIANATVRSFSKNVLSNLKSSLNVVRKSVMKVSNSQERENKLRVVEGLKTLIENRGSRAAALAVSRRVERSSKRNAPQTNNTTLKRSRVNNRQAMQV